MSFPVRCLLEPTTSPPLPRKTSLLRSQRHMYRFKILLSCFSNLFLCCLFIFNVYISRTSAKFLYIKKPFAIFTSTERFFITRRVSNVGVDLFQSSIKSIISFIFKFTHIWLINIHAPPPPPTHTHTEFNKAHVATDNHPTVMPGIHSWYTHSFF